MAAPASYSESSLLRYMDDVLGAVADALGWTAASIEITEALNETLLAYGVSDVTGIAGISNLRKLRALARREAWRAAMTEAAADYDFENEAGVMKRSQVFAQAQKAYVQAANEALIYDDQYNVAIETVAYADPYLAPDEDA